MDKVNTWKAELDVLCHILSKAGLTQTIKWGAPVFTYKGKNVVGAAGFKGYFALWFFNGVYLEDKECVLMNAQEGTTKAQRQWRFHSISDIDEELVLKYVKEAMTHTAEGKVHKPQKQPIPVVPGLLNEKFETEEGLQSAFEGLSLYKQKEYIEYLVMAKKLETQILRLQKIIPMIRSGRGLNDKYKDC